MQEVSVVKPTRALAKSGIYSTSKKNVQLRDAQVRYLLRKLRDLCPWLERSDLYVMRRFCELELLASRAYAALRASELTNNEGQSKRLLDDYRKLASLQIVVARELALSPAARQAIGANRAGEPLGLVAQFALDEQRERAALKRAKPAADGGEEAME